MGSGGMVVLDETDCMVNVAKYFLEFTKSRVLRQMRSLQDRHQAAARDLDEDHRRQGQGRGYRAPRNPEQRREDIVALRPGPEQRRIPSSPRSDITVMNTRRTSTKSAVPPAYARTLLSYSITRGVLQGLYRLHAGLPGGRHHRREEKAAQDRSRTSASNAAPVSRRASSRRSKKG